MVLKFIFQKRHWHIMKLTFLQMTLMAIFCTMTYAHDTKAQEILNSEVYIKPQNESLKNILFKIEKQTKVRFVYSDTRIPIEKEVCRPLLFFDQIKWLYTFLYSGFVMIFILFIVYRYLPK